MSRPIEIPLAVPVVGPAEARNLQACIDTGFVSSVGEFVTELERKVAASTGALSGVATSAGTTGLHAALTTVGVGRDDLVVTPSFTFIASANAISHCGATPWLMDIDGNWTLDLDQVERELETSTQRDGGALVHRPSGRRVAALMPVYTLGNLCDPRRLREIATRFALPIVADAAAAIGASWQGRPLNEGADLSVISFNGNKTVTAGGGGMIVGDNAELMNLARHLTTTARVSSDYSHDRVGFNYRMTNLQAAVGCAQMEQLPAFIAAKRRIRQRYREGLDDMAGLEFFPGADDGSSCWFSGVVLNHPSLPSARDIADSLRHQGIEARTFWKPVHLQTPYSQVPRADLKSCEGLWQRVLTLPCSTNLTDDQQDRVISALRATLNVPAGG